MTLPPCPVPGCTMAGRHYHDESGNPEACELLCKELVYGERGPLCESDSVGSPSCYSERQATPADPLTPFVVALDRAVVRWRNADAMRIPAERALAELYAAADVLLAQRQVSDPVPYDLTDRALRSVQVEDAHASAERREAGLRAIRAHVAERRAER